ncbi:MAG: hypothetical protein WA117_21730 [Verrucomicrobiia bacterium]
MAATAGQSLCGKSVRNFMDAATQRGDGHQQLLMGKLMDAGGKERNL